MSCQNKDEEDSTEWNRKKRGRPRKIEIISGEITSACFFFFCSNWILEDNMFHLGLYADQYSHRLFSQRKHCNTTYWSCLVFRPFPVSYPDDQMLETNQKNKQKTNERKTQSLGTIISSSCDFELSIVQVHIKSVLFTVPCHQLTAGRNQGGGRGNLSAQRLDSFTFIGRKEQRTNKTTQSESNSVLVCLCFLVSCCIN